MDWFLNDGEHCHDSFKSLHLVLNLQKKSMHDSELLFLL